MFGFLAHSTAALLLLNLVNGQFVPGPAPGCERDSVGAGNIHASHETYCQLFYHCNGELDRWTQACPPGTLFDWHLSVCVADNRATCKYWTCTAGTTRFPAICADEYFECSGPGFLRISCPAGQRFDIASGECSATATTVDHQLCQRPGDPDANWICYDYEDDTGNPCVYTTRIGSIEINQRPCSYGTAFSQAACQCSIRSGECPRPDQLRLSSVKAVDPECKPSFKLDFDGFPLVATSDKLDPAQNILPYQFQTIGVSVLGGRGIFGPDPISGDAAKLYAYFLTLNELSNPWAMRIRVQLENVGNTGQVQTSPIDLMVNNYNNACTPSLSAVLTYNNGAFNLNLDATAVSRTDDDTNVLNTGSTSGSIQMVGTDVLEVILLYDGALSAQLVDRGPDGSGDLSNVVDVPPTTILGGPIKPIKCGLTVAGGLFGQLDDFYIYEGCGDLNFARARPLP